MNQALHPVETVEWCVYAPVYSGRRENQKRLLDEFPNQES